MALEIWRTVPLRFLSNQSCWESGFRDSESDTSSIFEKAIMVGFWLSRLGEQCLFDFWENNPSGSLAFEIRIAVPLQFLSKQSRWEFGSRDSDSSAFLIFEKAILVGVWLSRFGERCLFNF
ncbi:hypothetical protein ACFX1Z_018387 [Malus domestica]